MYPLLLTPGSFCLFTTCSQSAWSYFIFLFLLLPPVPTATRSHPRIMLRVTKVTKKSARFFMSQPRLFFFLTRPRTHTYKCKCQNMRKSAAVSVTSQLVVDLFSLKNVVVEKRTRCHAVRILINIFEYLPLARSGLECGFLFLVSREEQFHR